MKTLVTGANGFVGQRLCSELEDSDSVVIPAVRRSHGYRNEVVIGDISGGTDWSKALAGCEVVVHLAACAHVVPDSVVDASAYFQRVNVEGTQNLARQSARSGVRRFVYLSSVKANGEGTGCNLGGLGRMSSVVSELRETDPPAPRDPYGISKYNAEQRLISISHETGMEVVIVRPPVVYGPGVKGNFSSMIQWVRRGVPLPFGAVHNRRSLIALDNLIDFILLCANREKSPYAAGEVFLISDGEDVSTTDLLHRVGKAYGVKPRLVRMPTRWICYAANLVGMRASADRLLGSLVVDSSKAREVLGWRPVTSMDEQLRKMARHDACL